MIAKIKAHNLPDEQRKKNLSDFYNIISSFNSYDEAKNFFKDLLTPSEMTMITRRIQVAKMLISGVTYEDIRENMKVGYGTIAQVEKWLNNGFGGYNVVLKKNKKIKIEEIPPSPFSVEDLRKRYPQQFLLLNLLMKKK